MGTLEVVSMRCSIILRCMLLLCTCLSGCDYRSSYTGFCTTTSTYESHDQFPRVRCVVVLYRLLFLSYGSWYHDARSGQHEISSILRCMLLLRTCLSDFDYRPSY